MWRPLFHSISGITPTCCTRPLTPILLQWSQGSQIKVEAMEVRLRSLRTVFELSSSSPFSYALPSCPLVALFGCALFAYDAIHHSSIIGVSAMALPTPLSLPPLPYCPCPLIPCAFNEPRPTTCTFEFALPPLLCPYGKKERLLTLSTRKLL